MRRNRVWISSGTHEEADHDTLSEEEIIVVGDIDGGSVCTDLYSPTKNHFHLELRSERALRDDSRSFPRGYGVSREPFIAVSRRNAPRSREKR